MARAFSIVFAAVSAWFLRLFVLRHLPAGLASIGSFAAPVAGIVGAWLQLGEVPSPFEATGMSLIVVALALLTGITTHRRDLTFVSEEPG